MPRLTFASLAVAVLALSGSAGADRMCVQPQKLHVERASEGSPDPLAATATAAADASHGPVEVPWCRAADDPRCRADENGEGSHTGVLSTAPPAALPRAIALPCAGPTRVRFDVVLDATSSGAHSRIERPPRA